MNERSDVLNETEPYQKVVLRTFVCRRCVERMSALN